MPPAVQAIRPENTRESILNEFGDLDLQQQHAAANMARHAVLKEVIVGWSKDESGDKPCVFTAKRWTVQFMPRENKRTIFDPRKAFNALKKIIGMDAAIALCEPALGILDKFVPEGQHKSFLTRERTGARGMKVIPTEPPEAA